MTIFERIKETSKKRGLNIAQLEKEAGLKERAIYAWKKSKPSGEALSSVADVLHVSTDYILGRTDQMNATSSDKKVADILDDETILAFDGMEIAEEDKEKLREYARFIIEQRQRGNK
ncbi:helix-turn-helix domain-containing protein [Leuconostoc lactis]|uniref:helix-turn-helix domain-containing protein n=1 Tax=Leuconostoc lactis TaxID=1246 RepID=UPI001D1133AA|nr:helix-turn-helix domain-containing protein [Leuconostoc lactis]MCC2745059.1 helix-turn-helix domain-containing protein [Leuconostoc lactis]MCC2755596.1 helix-turn-helix domain-containing protein [Leuconostoc lactis]